MFDTTNFVDLFRQYIYMDIKELIPKHKDDQKVIAGLKKLSFDELKPIIPELLEWMQDMNWPIADILKAFADRMIPELYYIKNK